VSVALTAPLVRRDGIVWVAVKPPLTRLSRCNNRMRASVGVFAGVLVGRRVAAECDAAALARSQVHPGGTNFDALLACALLRQPDGDHVFDVYAGLFVHVCLSIVPRGGSRPVHMIISYARV